MKNYSYYLPTNGCLDFCWKGLREKQSRSQMDRDNQIFMSRPQSSTVWESVTATDTYIINITGMKNGQSDCQAKVGETQKKRT